MSVISQLCGEIVTVGDGFIVLDVGGVGYRISMPATDIGRTSRSPGRKTIHTHLVVRDDSLSLYGFLDPFDLGVFQLLITVNRVGPQLALSVLSQIPAKELVLAVTGEDEKRLTRLSGIGSRNAKRLILELKDRMKELTPGLAKEGMQVGMDCRNDVVEALIALGFPSRDSHEAVDEACRSTVPPADPQAILKAAIIVLKERKKA